MSQLTGDVMIKKGNAIGWLLALALVGAMGVVVFRYAPFGETRAVTTPQPAANLSSPLGDTEYLLRHQDDALTALKEASSSIARSQDWTDRALSSLDDPALTARRLQVARSASRSAETQIDRAYTEIEIANSISTERKSK